LLYCGKPQEAKPLVERAALLGADPQKIVTMIFITLVAGLPLDAYMPLDKNFYTAIPQEGLTESGKSGLVLI
jgi:hypothetical protein